MAADYSINESRKDYIKRIRADGLEPSYPASNELQIDIDTPQHYAQFRQSFQILAREMMEHYNVLIEDRCTPSKSGLPSMHVRISLPFEVDTWQRIAWQAALGSDPIRELLSCLRAHRGDEHPTLLVEHKVSA